jgi:nicotinamidase-related amidase
LKGGIGMDRLLRIEREEAVLIVIDVQEVLMKRMDPETGKKVTQNIKILLKFAKEMAIPILITEQYPKGLGRTIPEIKNELGSNHPIEKVTFSCCGVETFNERLGQLKRNQVILIGIETHVCVLQTATDLIQKGYEVYVVADAVCSRKKLDWEIGLRWVEKKGAMIPTTEIIAFQLLKEAGTEEFKRLSNWLK